MNEYLLGLLVVLIGLCLGLTICIPVMRRDSRVRPTPTNQQYSTQPTPVPPTLIASICQHNANPIIPDEGAVCAICTDPLAANPEDSKSIIALTCSSHHLFHHACVEKWLTTNESIRSHPTCPLCRQALLHPYEQDGDVAPENTWLSFGYRSSLAPAVRSASAAESRA
jgi:hypothetical protein